jgi:hypothetical protein
MTGVAPIDPALDLQIIEEGEAAGEASTADDIVTDLTEPAADPSNPRWQRLKERKKRWKQSLNNLSGAVDAKSSKALAAAKNRTQQVLGVVRDNKGRVIMYLTRAREYAMTPENKEHARIVLNHLMKMTGRFSRSAGIKLRDLSGTVVVDAIRTAKVYGPEARDAAIRAANNIFRKAMDQAKAKGPDIAEALAKMAKNAASKGGSAAGSAGWAGGRQLVTFAGKAIGTHINGGVGHDGFQLDSTFVAGIPALDELSLEFETRRTGMHVCLFDGEILPTGDNDWEFPPELHVHDVLNILSQLKKREAYGVMLMTRLYMFAMNAPLANPDLMELIVERMTQLHETEVSDFEFHQRPIRDECIAWIASCRGTPYRMLPVHDVLAFWVGLVHALRCLIPECERYFDTKFSWHPSLPLDTARDVKRCILKMHAQ